MESWTWEQIDRARMKRDKHEAERQAKGIDIFEDHRIARDNHLCADCHEPLPQTKPDGSPYMDAKCTDCRASVRKYLEDEAHAGLI